ncbi:DUF4190 domain-containing protein [Candidatus Woesearchaeota archaeon]|nr:MAG: DUF4190 domain-containing protein [Candidatus Woesearchaeota archaeon]
MGKGLAIAGMVLGIVSIVFSWAWFIAIICGIVGLVLSLVALKKIKARQAEGKGMAIAGLVCSIVGIAIGVAIVIITAVVIGSVVSIVGSFA